MSESDGNRSHLALISRSGEGSLSDMDVTPAVANGRPSADTHSAETSLVGTINGRELAKLSDTLRREVRTYQFLRGKSPEDVHNLMRDLESAPAEHREALRDLRELIVMTKVTMLRMNQGHPGLPLDSFEKTLDLVSRPGASVVVLKGRDPSERLESDKILGYGIVIRGRENFPDADHIPERLFSQLSYRPIRLFVSDAATEQLPPGMAASLILDEMKELSPGGRSIGMVLTDIVPLNGTQAAPEKKGRWLQAKTTLEAQQFEPSGEAMTEVIEHKNGAVVAIRFEWYVWPPMSGAGTEQYERHKSRFRDLEERQRERMAGIMPQLPASGGLIHYSGTGRDAFDLAWQYPGNLINAEIFTASERRANREGRRPNLITAKPGEALVLPPNSTDAAVINGIVPDVIGNVADSASANERLRVHLASLKEALKPESHLIVRDTLGPSTHDTVRLRLHPDAAPAWCNGKTLVEVFSEFIETRTEQWVPQEEWNNVRAVGLVDGMQEFLVSHRIAAEFEAKAPYYTDWKSERVRPYTISSNEERVDVVTEGPFRLLYAGPERSAFVYNRYRHGLIEIQTVDGAILDPSPSNHITIAQKVGPGEGRGFTLGGYLPFGPRRFVEIHRYERIDPGNPRIGRIREVASRPNITIDVVPYEIRRGTLFVRGREYPRPLTAVHPSLDGSHHGGYLTEQIAAIVEPQQIASEEGRLVTVSEVMARRAGLRPEHLGPLDRPSQYFVRPDTVDEEVVAVAVRVPELPLEDTILDDGLDRIGSRYRIRTLDALRLLQSQQVGIAEDPRLERKIYQILRENKLTRGAWLGDSVSLQTQHCPQGFVVASADGVVHPAIRHAFRRVHSDESDSFLAAYRREFIERTGGGVEHGRKTTIEYVEPDPRTGLGHESVAVLPVCRVRLTDGREEILVGLEMKDLPAPQERHGSSLIATVPTTRLPLGCSSLSGARDYTVDKLQSLFGCTAKSIKRLGGNYVVSPGVTPEVIYPMIAEIDLETSRLDSLTWVQLSEVIDRVPELQCGQAITLLYRASHMLGRACAA